jgi:hypothetical protein
MQSRRARETTEGSACTTHTVLTACTTHTVHTAITALTACTAHTALTVLTALTTEADDDDDDDDTSGGVDFSGGVGGSLGGARGWVPPKQDGGEEGKAKSDGSRRRPDRSRLGSGKKKGKGKSKSRLSPHLQGFAMNEKVCEEP